jgi:hypothetical protein
MTNPKNSGSSFCRDAMPAGNDPARLHLGGNAAPTIAYMPRIAYIMNTHTQRQEKAITEAITEELFYGNDGAVRIEDQILGSGTENQFAHL